MDVRITTDSKGTNATVTGEADADNCDQLGVLLLDDAIVGPLAVDLSGLTFLDSSAISELLRVQKALGKREVVLSIVSPSPPVHRILEITGLLEIFGVATAE